MKKLLSLLALVLCFTFTCYAEEEQKAPKIIDAAISRQVAPYYISLYYPMQSAAIYHVLLLDEEGDLYHWDKQNESPLKISSNVAKLNHIFNLAYWEDNVVRQVGASRYDNIKEYDDNFYMGRPLYEWYLYYIDQNQELIFKSNLGETVLLQNAIYMVTGTNRSVVVLTEHKELYEVLDKRIFLIASGVKKIQGRFNDDLTWSNVLLALKENGDLLYYRFNRVNGGVVISEQIATDIADISLKNEYSPVLVKTDGNCYEVGLRVFFGNDEEKAVLPELRDPILTDVKSIHTINGMRIAVKNDGSVWYWGPVLTSKYHSTTMWDTLEYQEKPQLLYWDQEKNKQLSRARVITSLNKVDSNTKTALIKDQYEIYYNEFPEYFTQAEIQKYVPSYFQKNKRNASDSSKLPASSEPAPQSSAPQKQGTDQDSGLCLLLSIGIAAIGGYWFHKLKH